jgi:hypothetical protein
MKEPLHVSNRKEKQSNSVVGQFCNDDEVSLCTSKLLNLTARAKCNINFIEDIHLNTCPKREISPAT